MKYMKKNYPMFGFNPQQVAKWAKKYENLFKVANSAEQDNITVADIEEAMKRVGKGAQFK
ncbi:MAG: hypothetical protein NC247_05355 [Ruminococcus flavefaciens]|nr:hypothetical protein [Ruminococcus flavefaciens]